VGLPSPGTGGANGGHKRGANQQRCGKEDGEEEDVRVTLTTEGEAGEHGKAAPVTAVTGIIKKEGAFLWSAGSGSERSASPEGRTPNFAIFFVWLAMALLRMY
jgi:hypothetical protein